MVDKTATKSDETVDDAESSTTISGNIWSGFNIFVPTSLADLGFPKLGKYADTLVAIAKNPKAFVLGALVAALLGWILEIAKVFVDAISLILVGSSIGWTQGEQAGFEDLFYIIWDIISGAGASVGDPILAFVADMNLMIAGLAESVGVASFPVTVAVLVTLIAVAWVVFTKLGKALVASIPVIGPFLMELIE